jgi:putative flippase GtrA
MLRRMARRLIAFAAVGIAAALAHLSVAALLLHSLMKGPGTAPVLAANAAAFIVAFLVSYSGQRRWTFRSSAAHARLLPRYLLVAAAGLGVNEAVVATGMRAFGLPALLAIALAIVCVAWLTFQASQYWVFSQHEAAGTNPESLHVH